MMKKKTGGFGKKTSKQGKPYQAGRGYFKKDEEKTSEFGGNKREFGKEKSGQFQDKKEFGKEKSGRFQDKKEFGKEKSGRFQDKKEFGKEKFGEFQDKREFGKEKSSQFQDKREFGKEKSSRFQDKRDFGKGKSSRFPDKREFGKEKPRRFQEEREPYEDDGLQLEGRNAVLEALNNDKAIDKIFVRKSETGGVEGTLRIIQAKAKEKGIVVIEATKSKLDEYSHSGHHQGVIAFCPAIEYVEVSDILEYAKEKDEKPFILILDSITDPHNLGAIIRSAEACGVHGVIIPKRRSFGLSGIFSKTSAGAIQNMRIAKATNLNAVLKELKQAGVWIVAADMEGKNCFKTSLDLPVALLIGSEGEGIGRLLKENSDFTIRIPMAGTTNSLNASVAAAVVMYEVIRQRKFL